MNDIEIKSDTEKFKYRVNGIIMKNNKLLTIKMKNNISFCLPGGHVEFGEDSKSAIIREMLEELNTHVLIERELAIVENFYLDKKGLNTHEISFYYIVTPENWDNISLENYSTIENDKGELKEHHFEWLSISNLDQYDFRPNFIKDKLYYNNFDFEHFIIKQ